MSHRLTWEELPETVHRRVSQHLGADVATTISCHCGFSPSTAMIAVGENGRRLFVKAVRSKDSHSALELNRLFPDEGVAHVVRRAGASVAG